MRPRAEILLPFLEGCAHRQQALEFVLPRHRYPVRLCYGDRPWVKANALNPAIRNSRAGILVVADADVWTDGLPAAVEAVQAGASWAIPHSCVIRLAESASRGLREGVVWDSLPHAERVRQGVRGGGIVVARRDVLTDTPLDPRFIGWGSEDLCWGYALSTLHGEPWIGEAPLYHFWHPPQERLSRRWGSLEGKRLTRRYVAARGNPDAMRAILKEVMCPVSTATPTQASA